MRGKAEVMRTMTDLNRITPAYAGKSSPGAVPATTPEDHPRLCGEKGGEDQRCTLGIGSPPPMRGKVCVSDTLHQEKGITPAYAGKRYRSRYSRNRTQDHPRLCGEKLERAGCKMCRKGSPPPMRGKVLQQSVRKPHSGITPAYAGKSSGYGLPAARLRDHPRLCGEKSFCTTR